MTFRRREYVRKPVVYTPATRMGVYAKAGGGEAVPKVTTYRSEKHLARVRQLPCVDCGREGMTQAAHANQSKGMGIKASDLACCALCVDCHRRLDQGGKMTRAERRAYEWEMVARTYITLMERGMLG